MGQDGALDDEGYREEFKENCQEELKERMKECEWQHSIGAGEADY